jgi:hypothetical protein
MTGRDPLAANRVATPLELLFDLSFVVAFGAAANQFAHLVAAEHLGEGLLGFTLAKVSICRAVGGSCAPPHGARFASEVASI